MDTYIYLLKITVRNHLSCLDRIVNMTTESISPPKWGNSYLLPPTPFLQDSLLQEFSPFLQLPVFMPVYLPSSDLQNILTYKGCYPTLLILQNRDRNGWQHLLLQKLHFLLGLSRLQQGWKRVAQGEPALQRTYWKFTRHKSVFQLWLQLDRLRWRSVVGCCRIVSEFLF